MANIREQYIIDGVLTLTEGEKYRVKSGTFSGMVGKFTGLDKHYSSKLEDSNAGSSIRSEAGTLVQSPQEPVFKASLLIKGMDDEQGYLSLSPYNLELVK